ncbi:MAG: hypothetical protein IJ011_08225 [Clostridia bacterium]|nr:hypothetical protein [Clostridia bacterium]
MNILIVYSTHGGVTKKCAEMLAAELEEQNSITFADARNGEIPSPEGFDVVVLGSAIRMENMDRKIKKYVRDNLSALNEMSCAVYFCCGLTKLFKEYSETLLPKKFEPSLGFHLFGGELKPDKLSGVDKLIVMAMRSSIRSQDFEEDDSDHYDLPEIIPENITLLAKEIRILEK